MKNLEGFGVKEMNVSEIKKIDGGIFGIDDYLVGIAIGATLAIIADWENFKAGLTGSKPVKN